MIAIMAIQGCAYKTESRHQSGKWGGDNFHRVVAVMGGVSTAQKFGAGQRQRTAYLVEEQLFESGRIEHVPYKFVRESLGREFHDNLLAEYRNYGDVSKESLSRLSEVGLPAQYVIFTRLEKNETAKSEPTVLPVRNRYGDVLNDRVQVTLAHRRHVVMSAQIYELPGGNLAWQKAFESIPEATNTYVQYSGSSFAGSVAASVANSFANGSKVGRHPPAPNENTAIREAVREIVHAMSTSSGHW